MRKLIEDTLEIPLIQTEFQDSVAGATIANGPVRGIAVNTKGDNRNVWVRRMTLAHELGHLLYDSNERLEKLQVDQYSDLQKDPRAVKNYIEQRANAFAVEFLAPQRAVERLFKTAENYSSGLRLVMDTFGLSYTSAKYHVRNASNREIPLSALVVEDHKPTDEWTAAEDYATGFFEPQVSSEFQEGEVRMSCSRGCGR